MRFTLPLKPLQFYSSWSTSSDILHLHNNPMRRPNVVGISHFCWPSTPRPFPPGERAQWWDGWKVELCLPLPKSKESSHSFSCPNLAAHRLFHDWGSANETTLTASFPGNELIRTPEERLGLIPAKGVAGEGCVHGNGTSWAIRVWDSQRQLACFDQTPLFLPIFPKIFQPLLSTNHLISPQRMPITFNLTMVGFGYWQPIGKKSITIPNIQMKRLSLSGVK